MSRNAQLPVRVTVEAPARLHFGVLDLRGHLGRRFGGIGAAVPVPSVRLEAVRAEGLTAEGPDSGRAQHYARRYLEAVGRPGGAHLRVLQAIPAHVGLGSGTQLALAVARALAELYGLSSEPLALARAVGRGQRSAIGTWTFALGGFVLEGGRRDGSSEVAPLISRLPVPAPWRCVIAIPEGPPGLSGVAEDEAFRNLPPPSEHEVERVAHLVLMQLLPALAEGDLPAFGAALTTVQRITGGWFAPAQGGRFAPGATAELVARMAEFGACGVGQSSWGPATYAIVPDADAARDLARRVRALLGPEAQVYETGFAARGALVHAAWAEVGRD
ncbi:MAG TPA: beta-ribofuranosylaminobenzene 5'-phosphate synthase family protein [Gemmatimonadales bacterium]|jgi:beta-RFAP synthase|nr:beta-ribofuranosylaminobenzene 5'-phosphate synthase family protein [Gemmatimonadales bacterium]